MTRITLVVAALLLTNLASGIAAAADSTEHHSKNAQKVIVLLNSIGANSKQVKDFISDIDSNVQDGYLNLASRNAPGGKLSVRYRLGAEPYTGTRTAKRLEVVYQPKFNAHVDVIARQDSVTINYHLKF